MLDKINDEIKKDLKIQGDMREEFDSFLSQWIQKYKMSSEAHRAISYLMSSYVMMHKHNQPERLSEKDHLRDATKMISDSLNS